MVQDTDQVDVNGVIFSHWDLFIVVEDFYRKVEKDPELSIPFQSVHDWPEHIRRLTHFWWIRFGGTPYAFTYYNPIQKHFHAGFSEELLKRWLRLFNETLQERLTEKQAALWGLIADKMGTSLNYQNESMKENAKKV